ncbi:Rad52/Rad22 family DNA repair protein [Litchfieldella xinjiangensis]|uniref:Rad52/Rad22 family DNA repair protein n=1 Tax=Litchfieldella xinjiangensis TaxID=1166948 RepID=UPI0018CDC1A2|nr:Rad52/Rad22 family DNA repair protein [Halomonas xinjiangensis]
MTQTNDQHLAIWSRVEKTPTDAVKPAKVNGQNITAIDTMHMVKLATKIFGPVGIGWGYRIDVDRFDQGAPVLLKETVIGHEQTHTCQLTLWYEWEGKRGEVTHFGHTRAVYMTNKGQFITDNEAPKKSVTDAMKKCLSQLGFAADIYTGLFDDLGYVKLREAETRLEKAEDFDAELQKYRDDYADWLKRECDTLRHKVPHPKSIQLAADTMLQRINDRASVARVDPAKGADMIRKAAEDGIERVLAERQQQKQQQEEVTHG